MELRDYYRSFHDSKAWAGPGELNAARTFVKTHIRREGKPDPFTRIEYLKYGNTQKKHADAMRLEGNYTLQANLMLRGVPVPEPDEAFQAMRRLDEYIKCFRTVIPIRLYRGMDFVDRDVVVGDSIVFHGYSATSVSLQQAIRYPMEGADVPVLIEFLLPQDYWAAPMTKHEVLLPRGIRGEVVEVRETWGEGYLRDEDGELYVVAKQATEFVAHVTVQLVPLDTGDERW